MVVISKRTVWIGRALSGIVAAFLTSFHSCPAPR